MVTGLSGMAVITELERVIVPFRWRSRAEHPCHMSLRTVVQDLMAVGVLLSLISIIVFILFGAVISLLTVVRAGRRNGRRASHLDQLAGWSSRQDLAEIDEALERVMGEECGVLVGDLPG